MSAREDVSLERNPLLLNSTACEGSKSVSKSEINSTARKDLSKNGKSDLRIYLINIQCLLARLPELVMHLEIHQPHVVCLQETWLDASTKEISIPGYVVVARRDRHPGANRGGILTLRREDFNGLAKIADTKDEERSWMFLKSGVETVLLANWYRPGSSVHDGFA